VALSGPPSDIGDSGPVDATECRPRRRGDRDHAAGEPAHAHRYVRRPDDLPVRAGAEVVMAFRQWTFMRDPVGRIYCLTDRDPATGTPY
jgi:hypothetical protein